MVTRLSTALTVAGLAVAGLVLYRLVQAGPGLLSGDNELTRTATNAAGEPVTAYQGAGPVGTLGAAANRASGGWLATVGQNIGNTLADWMHPELRDASKLAADAADKSVPDSGIDWRIYGL